MKMLLFDLRESEKGFFQRNKFCDFDIKLIEEPLNNKTILSKEDYEQTGVLCVYRSSILSENVLKNGYSKTCLVLLLILSVVIWSNEV